MNQKVIQSFHIYILQIISTGFLVHVLILPILLSTSKRDSWLSVLFSLLPIILWSMIIFYIYKKMDHQNDLITFMKRKGSPSWIYSIFAFLFGLYFLFSAFITLKFTFFWAKGNYSFEVPNLMIIILFSLVCFYSSSKGIRTISTIAMLILPLVSFFGFFVAAGNIPNKNYELLFPLYEDGIQDLFEGIFYSCAGLFDMTTILFLTPFLKDKLKMKWVVLVGVILTLLTFGPLIGAISEFGVEEAAKMRNPAYEQWRLLKIGNQFTRLDFLSIFQWLSGAFVRISLSLFIANKLLSFKKKRKWVLPILYLLLIVSACVNWDSTSFFYFLQTYFFPYSLIFQVCALLFVLLLIKLGGDRHEKSSNAKS
ncbi:endospore germination permease [Bacillus sp. ISL-47]|uniref:GerAB/ArcD/ProY family transporter n=1 Tax=Bacillus sp. ISL-47 TaxID=2819130 RepID=UPI001BE8DB05|nr:endospore germination permease [Bacillus sp. ISL-47]MBT2686748.1 endospore germination permease [Bacillus sp. ISL-47]MBT2706904.1 endospore germination permease [Pseudomonas sp. ISL-84]